MSTDQFEIMLDTWLGSTAPEPRETLLASVLENTGRTRPMATWRAIWAVPAMRTQSAVLVGSPTVRLARVTLAVAAVVALAVTVALVGAWLLRELAPRGTIVFTSTQAINFEPEPTPRWWECGDDPDCIRLVTGAGEQTAWVYVLDPKGSEGPQLLAEIQVPRSTRVRPPLLSADGSYALITTEADPCSYDLVDLETGAFTRHLGGSQPLWSPNGSDLAYATTESADDPCGYGWFWGAERLPRVLHLLDARTGTDRALMDLDQVADWGRLEADPVHWLGGGRSLLLRAYRVEDRSYDGCYARWPFCPRLPFLEYVRYWYEELDVDTGLSRRLPAGEVSLPEPESLVGISPDGRKVLISHAHLSYGDDEGLSVAELDGSAGWDIGSACVESPSWSPDSRWIVYLDCRDRLERSIDYPNGDGIYDYLVVVASAERREQRIVGLARANQYPEMATAPHFAPDGSVVFWSDLDGTWAVAPDGSGLTRFDIPPDTSLSWR